MFVDFLMISILGENIEHSLGSFFDGQTHAFLMP